MTLSSSPSWTFEISIMINATAYTPDEVGERSLHVNKKDMFPRGVKKKSERKREQP